jgi:long-chain acyl-CoA synthetase
MSVIDVSREPTKAPPERAPLLGDFLRRHAGRKPEQTAFSCGDATITWAGLDRTSHALAHWLLDQGLAAGDRIALCAPNSIGLVQVYMALLKAGLVAVPINPRLKPDEVRFILEHSGPKMAYCDPMFAALLQAAGARFPVFGELPDPGAADTRLPAVAPEALGLIVYTSGTTARPKGVAHSQGALCQKGLKGLAVTRHVQDPVCLIYLPMMHISGIWSLAMAICQGYAVVMLPRFDAAAALDTIERFGCTNFGGLPTMILAMVEEQSARPRRIATLQAAFSGGDAVAPALQARFEQLFGVPLLELYAMTEICAISANTPGASRAGSLGRPLDGVEVRVVDLDGRDVARGESGEIILRASSLAVGYWADPEATRAAMGSGWLHTGDLGALDVDGFIWFRGRKKEVIIRAGSNISPQEVEEALYKHPAVLEAGVIGLPDPVTIERVAAFVVLRDGETVSAEELRAFARKHIADYKAPEEIHFREALPRNAVGKVQRRALKELLPAG